MRKIILLIFILFIIPSVYAATSTNDQKDALKKMSDSHRDLHNICVNAADNFRYDHQFAGYLKYTCMMYESNRSRLMASVYTVSTELTSEDKKNYPVYMSNFAIKMNNDETNRYKAIISEYCKYNAYKYAKKDPQACSADRLNSLFNNN